MQLLKALWALAGAALCCFLVLVIHAQFLKEGNCSRRARSPALLAAVPARDTASSTFHHCQRGGPRLCGAGVASGVSLPEPSAESAASWRLGAQGWHGLRASPGVLGPGELRYSPGARAYAQAAVAIPCPARLGGSCAYPHAIDPR